MHKKCSMILLFSKFRSNEWHMNQASHTTPTNLNQHKRWKVSYSLTPRPRLGDPVKVPSLNSTGQQIWLSFIYNVPTVLVAQWTNKVRGMGARVEEPGNEFHLWRDTWFLVGNFRALDYSWECDWKHTSSWDKSGWWDLKSQHPTQHLAHRGAG